MVRLRGSTCALGLEEIFLGSVTAWGAGKSLGGGFGNNGAHKDDDSKECDAWCASEARV